MKRVQIFSDTDDARLQEKVNEWMAGNKEVEIAATNIACLDGEQGKMVFYILYTPPNAAAKEMEILAQQENTSVISKEITPDARPDLGTQILNTSTSN